MPSRRVHRRRRIAANPPSPRIAAAPEVGVTSTKFVASARMRLPAGSRTVKTNSYSPCALGSNAGALPEVEVEVLAVAERGQPDCCTLFAVEQMVGEIDHVVEALVDPE